jgi:hypothetical protein
MKKMKIPVSPLKYGNSYKIVNFEFQIDDYSLFIVRGAKISPQELLRTL